MSLRARLSIIVSLLCLTGIVLGMGYLIGSAKQRVADEVESTATLAYQLLNAVLSDLETTLSPEDQTQLLQRLLAIEDARHLDISIQQSDSPQAEHRSEDLVVDAPAWFVSWVQPEPIEFSRPINDNGQNIILIRANPADEIAEVWIESKNFMAALTLVLIVLNTILYITIGWWFRPVKRIVEGLDEVEHGNFTGVHSKTSLPELKVITEKINSLAAVLRASKEENHRLAKRSLLIQEEERKHLAQELHDEMGQSISAIKAIAFSIHQRTRGNDANSAAGAEKIGSISSHVHGHVRSMMSKLRPTTLDELGLIPALQHMVDEWNENHSEKFCSVHIADEFEQLDAEKKISIYRIIQEALTNAARHSSASEVKVHLSYGDDFQLSISDNGIGFNLDEVTPGLGLTGIKERVQALGGVYQIASKPGNGVCINIQFGGT